MVRLARHSAGRLHRHLLSPLRPKQSDRARNPALRAPSSSHARAAHGHLSVAVARPSVSRALKPNGRITRGPLQWQSLQFSACVPRFTCNAPYGRSTLIAFRFGRKPISMRTQTPPAAHSATSAFTLNGYQLLSADQDAPLDPTPEDDLSFTARPGDIWVEKARSPHSQIVAVREPARVLLDDAREPTISADGQILAFIRDHRGRGRLMMRPASFSDTSHETQLTPAPLNVYEASFRSEHEYAFSAVENGRPPQIYLTDSTHANAPLALGESRYPALSPDGAWLAYSHLDHGVWNLWLRDQRSGAVRRIADIPCNQIQPAWEDDSRTLLYGADCGRSLWFTAISRRRVIP